MPAPHDLATQTFTRLVQAAAAANIAMLSARLDSRDGLGAAAASPGLDEAALEDDAVESVLVLTSAFRQLRDLIVLGSTMSLDAAQIDEMGANAKPPTGILVLRDPERVLTDFYEHGNPEAVGRFFSRPGTAESVVPDSQSIRLHYYKDGSMLARTQSLSKPNLDLRLALLDSAATFGEAMSATQAGEVSTLLTLITLTADQIIKDHDMAQKAIDMVPALINEQALALARSLTQAAGLSVWAPIADNGILMTMINKHAEEDGLAWKSGLSIEVDGLPCPTPAHFKSALGIYAPASLDGALERLRKSRQLATNPAPKEIAPPKATKKPKSPK